METMPIVIKPRVYTWPTFFAFSFFLLTFFSSPAQWLNLSDETATRLTLTSVAQNDDEEKDFWTADLNNDGWADVIVVRKEPFSLSSEPAKSDLLLMNVNGVMTDLTSTYAPEFITNISFARDLYIGDFDNDGWEDVVIANTFQQAPIYYANLGEDGAGNWLGLQDQSASRLPTLIDDVPLICAVLPPMVILKLLLVRALLAVIVSVTVCPDAALPVTPLLDAMLTFESVAAASILFVALN